jgi:hypothetical protein
VAESDAAQAEQLLRDLTDCLRRLEITDSRIAAAYLDSAIEAFCREQLVERYTSKTD